MKILKQLLLLLVICLAGEGIAQVLPFAFPASVISMLILFALLLTGVLKLAQVQDVTSFLTGNMAFFFISPIISFEISPFVDSFKGV